MACGLRRPRELLECGSLLPLSGPWIHLTPQSGGKPPHSIGAAAFLIRGVARPGHDSQRESHDHAHTMIHAGWTACVLFRAPQPMECGSLLPLSGPWIHLTPQSGGKPPHSTGAAAFLIRGVARPGHDSQRESHDHAHTMIHTGWTACVVFRAPQPMECGSLLPLSGPWIHLTPQSGGKPPHSIGAAAFIIRGVARPGHES
jgi:hypothetical protein